LAAPEATCAERLPTIWTIPDELWGRIEPILLRHYQPAKTGRPRAGLRLMLDGIIFRLRTGCQWNQMPERFGASSTLHDWFQRYVKDGVLTEIWADLVAECEELGGVEWEWQAADG
jgi:transposase